MTRQHFEAFAEAIRNRTQAARVIMNHEERQRALYAARECAILVADVATQFNPAFNRARFMRACRVLAKGE